MRIRQINRPPHQSRVRLKRRSIGFCQHKSASLETFEKRESKTICMLEMSSLAPPRYKVFLKVLRSGYAYCLINKERIFPSGSGKAAPAEWRGGEVSGWC